MAEAIVPLIGLGVGLYQKKQSDKAAKQASRESQAANAQQLAMQQQQLDAMRRQPADEAATMTAARDRQRALAAAAYGRGDTIQTSPTGALGMAPTASKTLIGA